jgi:hypothetical protein
MKFQKGDLVMLPYPYGIVIIKEEVGFRLSFFILEEAREDWHYVGFFERGAVKLE